ncbi:MAG: dihydrodipicolinate synthase family protein [Treponema sp.]|nr:dihydrodipicolinate synthase family protein [Treponema sp.]
MPKKYHGVIPPVITPVDEQENVDEQGFRALLRHCVDRGIHGIFVAGTNGESLALTQSERDRAIKIAIDEVGKQVPVMAGVMDSSTRRVVENIKRFEQMGGTCAVITPVFYARHSLPQEETIRHFEDISRETNIDLVVYNIPLFTSTKLSAATICKIANIDNVVAIKDSSGDFIDFQKILRVYKSDPAMCVLQGLTVNTAASLLMGADGYVPSIAPLFPELFVAYYDAGRSGDIERTMLLHEIILDTSDILGMAKDAFAANKFAISLLGLTDKRVIRPVTAATPGEENAIRAKVDEIRKKIRDAGIKEG